jgi:hypothetical protein
MYVRQTYFPQDFSSGSLWLYDIISQASEVLMEGLHVSY